MKWSIFCLSLALCAFEAVIAYHADPNNYQEMTDKQKVDALVKACDAKMVPMIHHAQNVLKAELKKSKCPKNAHCRNVCVYESTQDYTAHYNLQYDKCGNCFTTAFQKKDLGMGLDCCPKAVSVTKRKVNFNIVAAKKCIAKCDKPIGVTGKNTKNPPKRGNKNDNQDPDENKMTKDQGPQTEANPPKGGKKNPKQNAAGSKQIENEDSESEDNGPDDNNNPNQNSDDGKNNQDQGQQVEANTPKGGKKNDKQDLDDGKNNKDQGQQVEANPPKGGKKNDKQNNVENKQNDKQNNADNKKNGNQDMQNEANKNGVELSDDGTEQSEN